jgi:polyphosphate kinase 2 (PPK2 family)
MYDQKKMFEDVMVEHNRDFIVFYLDISEEEAEKRLHHRKICSTCGTTYSTLLEP